MRLIVAPGKSFHVHGKHLQEGEEFEVPDEDGKRWIAFGLAHDVAQAPRPPRHARHRAMKPEPEPKTEIEPGKYHRTDLRAED
jgi:hypothetical protein